MGFTLDPRLATDTHVVREEEDLLVLMMNDERYPWFIVVPKVDGITEWHDLPQATQVRLHLYCVELGKHIQTVFDVAKINIAALGNVVSQLHVHVVGRTAEDPAWPKPVWGHSPAQPYTSEQAQSRMNALNQQIAAH